MSVFGVHHRLRTSQRRLGLLCMSSSLGFVVDCLRLDPALPLRPHDGHRLLAVHDAHRVRTRLRVPGDARNEREPMLRVVLQWPLGS